MLGSAGTVGTITAALGTGVLAAVDLSAPFFVGSAVILALLVVTLFVGGAAMRSMRPALP